MTDEAPQSHSGMGGAGDPPSEAELVGGIRHVLAHLLRLGISHIPRSPLLNSAEDLRQLREVHGVQLLSDGGRQNGPHDQNAHHAIADSRGSKSEEQKAAVSSLQERRKQAGAAISKGAYGASTSDRSSSVPGTDSIQREASSSSPTKRFVNQKEVVIADAGTYSLPVLSAEEREDSLSRCEQEVGGCTVCPSLAIARKKTVFGEGSVQPRFCFFGEAPGAEEDRSGRPFVGPAGQLLTKMIEACTLRREDVYILNTIKCRPPGNRNPELDEVANCRHFFERQFEILQPEYIVCLGAIASRALLKTTLAVGQLRGIFHQYKQSKVLVTYHPSYLLRQPEAKKAAWEDLQMLMRDAGVDLSSARKPRSPGG